MKNAPTNTDYVIDSRDVIERIGELEFERDNHTESPEKWAEEHESDADELKALLALQEQAEGYAPDWRHGATLIRDSYFETYARDVAHDIGAIPDDVAWPCSCVDWEQAARELQQDYTSVEFDGVTYWVR